MESFIQDVRLGFRQLLRRPSTTIIVILTLGLGVGANTSMLALLNATLFKAPPVPDAGQLNWIAGRRPQSSRPTSMSYPDFRDLRDQAKSFSGVFAYASSWVALGGATPERVPAQVVSGNYFDVLGVRPVVGRTFRADEDSARGARPVVVISHALWNRRFGGALSVTDSLLTMNGHQFAIIGVAPEGFGGLEMNDDGPLGAWATFAMIDQAMPGEGRWLESRRAGWLRVVGRLAPTVSTAAAGAEIAVIAARAGEEAGPADDRRTFVVLPLIGALDPNNRAEIAGAAPLLMAVPLLLLAVAWANAANVLLARTLQRRKEIAVRRALGASRARIVRQLLTEGSLVAIASAVAGVMLSYWLTALITRFGGIPEAILAAIVPDGTVVVATALLAVGTGVLFGLAPALAATRPQLTPALKEDGATVSLGRQRHRLRDLFLVGQVAISLTLLITGGLFVQSVAKMLRVDPGFAVSGAYAASFDLQMQGYDATARSTFERRVLDQAAGIAGVQSVALVSAVPFGGRLSGDDVVAEGTAVDGNAVGVFNVSATKDLVGAQGLRLMRGRGFAEQDQAGAPLVAVITQGLAKRLWPDGDAVGKRLHFNRNDQPLREVVGVVADVQYDDLAADPRGVVYLPLAQVPASPLTLIARGGGDAAALAAPVGALVRSLDPNLPLYGTKTLAAMMAENGADKREAAASMVAVFGAIALFLAALGIYGVTSHGVTLRTREIGIRMSLGAQRAHVVALFVREGLRRTVIGVVLGIALSLGVSKVLSKFLFGLGATDAATFVAGAVLLSAVAAAASYLPARRSARIDPVTSLRTD